MNGDVTSPGELRSAAATDASAEHALPTDVFLSHNSRDKPAVERIAERLKRAGIEPWLDIWSLTPGGRWQDEIVDGLRHSSACAVFIGPHGLGDWVREELAIALDHAAKDRRFRLFVVLLPGVPEPFDPTTLPPFLSTRTWVDLRHGHEGARAIQGLINAVRGVALGPASAQPVTPGACPYQGLEAFDEDDAEFFYGREPDIQRLIEQLRETRCLAVLGSSGTGKSSLVRAGVVPALRAGRLPGSDRWPIEIMRPGVRPLVELCACLTRVATDQQAGMQQTLDRLETDQRTLDLAVALALTGRPESERFVLIVDQFEEVFTLCHDDAERNAFLDNLLYASRAPGGRCVVILTMRADFYPRCAARPEFAQQIAHTQYLVSPLDAEGLRQAIAEPAYRVGLEFEEGLVETILDDVEYEPGALPLLEHALLELWQQRVGTMLTLETYQRIGRVAGALARRADATYESLSPEHRKLARLVLLRLTQPGDGSEDTRCRSTVAELQPADASSADLNAVLQTLVSARLLTIGGDIAGAQTVDVAHEALIRGWPRLRAWIDEDRAGLRQHRRITEAAQEWARLGRDESGLLRGARLATAQEWRVNHEESLNPLERDFLGASAGLLARERWAARRRTRRTIVALSAALAITTSLAIAAVVQREWAQSSEQRAITASNVAFSQELAANSRNVLADDAELGLRLALEAVKVQENPISTEALRRALLATRLLEIDRLAAGFSGAAAASPDGTMLALGGDDGSTELRDPASGERIATLPVGDAEVRALAFSPDGGRLAVVDENGALSVWDVEDRAVVSTSHAAVALSEPRFSPDGESLLVIDAENVPRVIDVATGETLLALGGDAVPADFTIFAGDGDLLVTLNASHVLTSWALSNGEQVARLDDFDPSGGDQINSLTDQIGGVIPIAAVPGTSHILLLAFSEPLSVWDAATGEMLEQDGALGSIVAHDASVSASGERVALAGQLGFTGVWNMRSWTLLSWAPGGSIATGRAFLSRDGALAAVLASDGRVHIWNPERFASGVTLVLPVGNLWNVILNAERRLVVATSEGVPALVFSYAAINADASELRSIAEERAPRELTDQERALYLHEGDAP